MPEAYAAANGGKYPWAADMVKSGSLNQYHDYEAAFAASRYGRIPDPLFTRTSDDPTMMNNTWVGRACKLPVGTWWTNWKSQVLYAIALSYQPGGSTDCAIGGCLTVNRPTGGPVTNVRMVVMVAGRALDVPRFDRIARLRPDSEYEPRQLCRVRERDSPAAPDPTFEIRAIDATFNDRLAYFPP